MTSAADIEHLRAALALGARNLGRTWPNPSVGCVIVRGGAVISRGWTQVGGRPHAEAEALARAGPASQSLSPPSLPMKSSKSFASRKFL